MKFIHISDLHLGRRLGEFRLQEEQSALLDWVLRTATEHDADGIFLAGDIFDRSVPPVEAVTLFDTFLTRLAAMGIPLFAISGNHDSPERIAYGSSLMDGAGIYVSPCFDGSVRRIPLEKDGERVYIHLLPFLKPIHAAAAYGLPEEEVRNMTCSSAIAEVFSRMTLPRDGANILLCHQFITGSTRSASEEIPLVGTLDAADAGLFAGFDYVALGHLHRAQAVSEEKGCLLVEIRDHAASCTFLPVPAGLTRTLITLSGTYDTLISRDYRESCPYTEDYLKIQLEEDTPVPDAMAKLSVVYPRIVQLSYRRQENNFMEEDDDFRGEAAKQLSPEAVFASFYVRQNETELSEEDREYIRSLLAEGGESCGL